jgi:hypothetical protein
VALEATGNARLLELRTMHILMTRLTLRRSGFEVYVEQIAFHRWRAMASRALHHPMRSR